MSSVAAALLCIPLSLVLFCSMGPSDALVSMQKAYSSGKKEKIMSLYTKGTADALGSFESADGGSLAVIGERLFDREAEWVVIEEKTEGSDAMVRVRYTRHSAENMRGYEYVFRLRNEGGAWRVDMEREVRASADMASKSGKKKGTR